MRVAVLAPCRDEATTVAQVVAGFKATLPDALIYDAVPGPLDAAP